MANSLIPTELITNYILYIRGQKVILDSDLAMLYGVSTKRLNEQVKRNRKRFPNDFLFRLTKKEKQEVVAICDHLEKLKFSRIIPNAFTEHGVIMAASILNSKRAIDVSVFVVRAFIKLREMLSTHKELKTKFAQLENRLNTHDQTIRSLVMTIRELMNPAVPTNKRPIGFAPWPEDLAKKRKKP